MVVEVNEYYGGDEESFAYYFRDLAQVNGAESAELLGPPEDGIAVGIQRIRKAGEQPDAVLTCLGLVRLPDKKSDVLITWLLPHEAPEAAPRDLFRRVCASFR